MTDVTCPTPLREQVRAAISDSYYDARNDGRTMEQAADIAVDKVSRIVTAHCDRTATAEAAALAADAEKLASWLQWALESLERHANVWAPGTYGDTYASAREALSDHRAIAAALAATEDER